MEGQNLPDGLRVRLEQLLAEMGERIGFDMAQGNVRVTFALENGHYRWMEPTILRVPASRFEELAARETR